MSVINQLLSKAMSTPSEEEAVACLKMARKKGNVFDGDAVPSTYNGHTAKYWYDKAATYYNIAKKKQEPQVVGLSITQQQQLYNMYTNAEKERAAIHAETVHLRSQIKQLKQKLEMKKKEYIFAGIFFGIMIAFAPALVLTI